jgi:hypothetical protein
LNLNYDEPLSISAFKFKLRRYVQATEADAATAAAATKPDDAAAAPVEADWDWAGRQGLTLVHFSAQLERFVWIGGARMDCVAHIFKGVLGGVQGV